MPGHRDKYERKQAKHDHYQAYTGAGQNLFHIWFLFRLDRVRYGLEWCRVAVVVRVIRNFLDIDVLAADLLDIFTFYFFKRVIFNPSGLRHGITSGLLYRTVLRRDSVLN